MVGFGILVLSHLYYYWCSRGFGPGDYHLHLTEVPTLWVHLSSHLLPLVVLGILSSSITFLHHINLCCWYFVPPGVDPHMIWEGSKLVWISGAGCHRLTFGAFCTHTGCWSRNGGRSLEWASCPAYFYPLEGLLPCCRGSCNCLVGCFQSSASHH